MLKFKTIHENTAYAKNKSKEAVEIGSVIKHTCVFDTRSIPFLCIYLNMHVGPNITCSSYLCCTIKPFGVGFFEKC